MKYHIFNNTLFRGKNCVGIVKYIDYKNIGSHGYCVSKIKNQTLLQEFHKEANKLFPNSENPYIEYLDMLMK